MKKLLFAVLLLTIILNCTSEEAPEDIPTEEIAIISTEYGDMYLLLYDKTPKHKENFLKLAKEGFYDSTTFHRVIEGFMIQGGDPNSKDEVPFNDGQGGPGYTLDAEFNRDLIHKKGAIAAARLGDEQNPEKRSSGSQFYIVHGQPVNSLQLDQLLQQQNMAAQQDEIRKYVQAPENTELLARLRQLMSEGKQDSMDLIIQEIQPVALEGFIPRTYTSGQRAIYSEVGGAPFLDGNYTVFGEVIEGTAVIDSIAAAGTSEGDRPISKIPMTVTVESMPLDSVTQKFGYEFN